MTLVAALSPHGYPIMLCDLLIVDESRTREITYIPTKNAKSSEYLSGFSFTVSGLRQKIELIGNNCAIGCCGSIVFSKALVRSLKNTFHNRNVSYEELMAVVNCCEGLDSINFVGQIIMSEKSYTTVTLHPRQSIVHHHSCFGHVHGIGSGCKYLEYYLNNIPELHHNFEMIGGLPPSLNSAVSLVGSFIHCDVIPGNEQTLYQAFGGGYEFVYQDEQNKLRKLDDVTFITWEAVFDKNGFVEIVEHHVMSNKYDRNVLIVSSLFFEENGTEKMVPKLNIVPPAHLEISKKELDQLVKKYGKITKFFRGLVRKTVIHYLNMTLRCENGNLVTIGTQLVVSSKLSSEYNTIKSGISFEPGKMNLEKNLYDYLCETAREFSEKNKHEMKETFDAYNALPPFT